MSEKIELLTEFLNMSIQVSNCMKTKCKIIDENIKKIRYIKNMRQNYYHQKPMKNCLKQLTIL